MEQKTLPIQQSFTSGELTPRVRLRSDLEGYHMGCEVLENFESLAHGPAARRDGFRHVESVDISTGRIIPFYVSLFVGYIIIVTVDTLAVFDFGGAVIESNLLTNYDLVEGNVGWESSESNRSSVIFEVGAVELNSNIGVADSAIVWQESSLPDPLENYVVSIRPHEGPDPMTVRIGYTEHGEELHLGSYPSNEEILIPLGTGLTGNVWVECEMPGGLVATKTLDLIGLVELEPASTVTFPSPWAEPSQIKQIQWDMPPGGKLMVLCQMEVPQQELKLEIISGVRTWTLIPIVFTDPPASWVAGNYPGCITFHEGRMWQARLPDDGEAFWASQSGDYYNFDLGTGLDAEALSFSIDRRGAICWMAGLKDLIIGTERAEYIVKSSSGIITSSDISIEAQTHHGSAFIQSATVGSTVVFVNIDHRKLREMHYSWTDGGWVSQEISFMAEHIPREDPIIELSFAQNPNSIVVCTTLGGRIAACTYDPEKQLVGWYRHTTQGAFLSTCVLPYGGYGYVWALINRNSADDSIGLERTVEKMYMDSAVRQIHGSPTDVIDPVPHLAGKTVQVVGDGSVQPDITLDSAGEGTVKYPASDIQIGLQYISTLITMPIDKGNTAGSSQSMKKRWSKLFVSVLESYKPRINGKRPATRHPSTPMNTSEVLLTEDLQVTNLGWDREAKVKIEAELPLPCTVTGIFGEMGQKIVS